MKILAIRGKNLASLEGEFDIDFTKEPLKSAGIFAITGSTGSGKSTLLDALCLALFDDTPRISRASENSIHIADVKNKTITQGDCRNILRRGTSDGYAEVDFVSLGGEKFRSRWSARRSRDKIDGALQASELRLTNLAANIEAQGRKTELLAKITELIGLTFDQFTRAVLLAQGDFATFLKATQKEKAELLEKLTGTEIYSRISMAIFEKSKAAEQDLNLLKERIKDVQLLSEEEQETLSEEKNSVVQEIETAKKTAASLTAKIKWISEERDFNAKLQQAEEALSNAKQAVEAAKPRTDYLTRLDSVQEIRDTFNERKNADKQLSKNRETLEAERKLHADNVLSLHKKEEEASLADAALQHHNEDFTKIEPLIKQARELDVQINAAKSNESEAGKEHQQARETKTGIEKSIAAAEKELENAKTTLSKIGDWFEKYRQYKEIIPRIDLILNSLSNLSAAKKQAGANAEILSGIKSLLENETAELQQWQENSERLNKLLPTEIVTLRAKLMDGEPCPVCGSLRHPAGNLRSESLEEAEIEKEKKATKEKITLLTERIANRNTEIIRLTSLIESYESQAKEKTIELDGYLSTLPQWKTESEEDVLANSLKRISDNWKKSELKRAEIVEQIANLETASRFNAQRLSEAAGVLTEKEAKHKAAAAALTQFLEKRKTLFEGETADKVEKRHNDQKKKLTDALAQLNKEKNGLVAANEKQKGAIGQLSQEIERLTERSLTLQKTVADWLAARNDDISEEQLSELLSKSNQWLLEERATLNRLQQNVTKAETAFSERRQNLENHLLSEHKPSEEEPEETLKTNSLEQEELTQQKTKRLAEIDVAFNNHREGEERVKKFEKALEEKGLLSENWKKLNDLLGSADGAKFKVLAQGYTLDALLSYANKHLQELSKRYEIQRISDTLALQVIDLDMLGEVRTVHSLSGGESFLISLALALGLSSLSSNRMKIESLFIDEGFGSLDVETLRVAMDALERLQTQGRKIGVISHVAEMTERISAQIHVEKMANGRSKVEVKG